MAETGLKPPLPAFYVTRFVLSSFPWKEFYPDLRMITDLEEEQVDSKSSVNVLVGKSFFEQLLIECFTGSSF